MSREKRFDRGSLTEERSTMRWVAGNGLTLEELEQLEEAAHHSQTVEAKSVLRLALQQEDVQMLLEALKQAAEDLPAGRKKISKK